MFAKGFQTLTREHMAAFQFLSLQQDAKDWMQRVTGQELPEDRDFFDLCKDGTMLCELINKMFPGCIKKFHPAGSPPIKAMENISLFLKVCEKMGMKPGLLADPADVCQKKNVMKFMVTIEYLAKFVAEKGYPVPWKENMTKRNFAPDELEECEIAYSPSRFAEAFAKMKKEQRKELESQKKPEILPAEPVKPEAPPQEDEAGKGKKLDEEEDTPAARQKKMLAGVERTLDGRCDTTKLHLAVQHKLDPAVRYMIEQKVWDIKKPDGDGNTPLHIATIVGNDFALGKLIEGGAPISYANHDGNTPLHLAVAGGKSAQCAALIKAGANLKATNKFGDTPLHLAAETGDVGIMDQLLAARADVNARNADGNTPLHLAAWDGNLQQVKALLAAGADPQVANADGNTPLHFAALRGHKEVIDALLAAKADVNARNADNATPLQLATEADEQDCVEMMSLKGGDIDSENVRGWTPLYTACYNGNRDMVNYLMQRGAEPNHQNADGWAPLHAACSNGHAKIVEDMIKKFKAKVDVQTLEGTTPLYFASQTGRKAIVELLLASGANVNLCKAGGWQPLHGSVYNDFDAITQLLLDAKAEVDNGVDEIKGYAPMHIAIASEDAKPNVVRMLLKANASIDKQTSNGATPLHLAVFWGNSPIVEYLISKGARLDLKNNKGRRPLDLAAHYGHKEIAEFIANKMGEACPAINSKAKPKVADMSTPAEPPKPDDYA